jgi:hypothetical protein
VADAFQDCPSPKYACFEGNAPTDPGNAFADDFRITNVFYVPGTIGWGATYSGIPSAPCVACSPLSFFPQLTALLPQSNGRLQFRFIYPSGAKFTVFASTNLALPFNQWANLGPAVETPPGSGQYQFTDSQSTNYGQRYYRVKSQ